MSTQGLALSSPGKQCTGPECGGDRGQGMKIPLCRPFINEETKAEVLAVLDSGMLTEGALTRELEALIAEYVGARFALAVTSCTTGLEIALRCLGVGPGHEVIVPDYTFPATAQAVLMVGATPVLVDVDPGTMLLDYEAARQAVSSKTQAIIPVSNFGNPLDYEQIDSLKREFGLFVLEDAACALGARMKGRPVGSLADISVFSLHPRKFITTGEGGIITTDNDKWDEWVRSYSHFGMDYPNGTSRSEARFVRIGTNAKLTNLQAAVGVVQMRRIDQMLAKRIELTRKYFELLSPLDGVSFPKVTAGGEHSYQSCCVFVDEPARIIDALRSQGIEAQIGAYALHMQEVFKEHARIPGEPKGSRHVFDHCLALPLYQEMSEEEQEIVAARLSELVRGGH